MFELNGVLKVVLKLDLLNTAFSLVHSSVERSTSRHGHLQASARLLYRLALVLVLGLIVWKWVNLEHFMDSNQEYGIGFGNSPGSLSHFLAYSRKLGNHTVLRVYAALNPQEEQICLY